MPVIAYALASGVGLARMNVRRHAPDGEKSLSWNLVPVPVRRGAGMGIRLEIGGW